MDDNPDNVPFDWESEITQHIDDIAIDLLLAPNSSICLSVGQNFHEGSVYKCRLPFPAMQKCVYIFKRDVSPGEMLRSPDRTQNEYNSMLLFKNLTDRGYPTHIPVPKPYSLRTSPDDLQKEYLTTEFIDGNQVIELIGEPPNWSWQEKRAFYRQMALFHLLMVQIQSPVIRAVTSDPTHQTMGKIRGRVLDQRDFVWGEGFWKLGPYKDSREMALAHMDRDIAYWQMRHANELQSWSNFQIIRGVQQQMGGSPGYLGSWSESPPNGLAGDGRLMKAWNYPTQWLNHLRVAKKIVASEHKFRSKEDELCGSYVLDHGDIPGGNNILRNGHKMTAVIDWEMASFVPYSLSVCGLNTARVSAHHYNTFFLSNAPYHWPGVYDPEPWREAEQQDAAPFNSQPPVVFYYSNPEPVSQLDYLEKNYPVLLDHRGKAPAASLVPDPLRGNYTRLPDYGFVPLAQDDFFDGDRRNDDQAADEEDYMFFDYDTDPIDDSLVSEELPEIQQIDIEDHPGGTHWFDGNVWSLVEPYILQYVDQDASLKKYVDLTELCLLLGYVQPRPVAGGTLDLQYMMHLGDKAPPPGSPPEPQPKKQKKGPNVEGKKGGGFPLKNGGGLAKKGGQQLAAAIPVGRGVPVAPRPAGLSGAGSETSSVGDLASAPDLSRASTQWGEGGPFINFGTERLLPKRKRGDEEPAQDGNILIDSAGREIEEEIVASKKAKRSAPAPAKMPPLPDLPPFYRRYNL